jgi:hypothetical protein
MRAAFSEETSAPGAATGTDGPAAGGLPPAVKSQPVYASLAADLSGRRHLLVAEPEGLEAVLRVLDTLDGGEAPVEVYWLGVLPEALSKRGAACVRAFDGLDRLKFALAQRLATAGMGLRLYLAGRETFLWEAGLPARDAGLREDEIRREACGSRVRRVFCVHCRTITEGVTTSPAACSGCGLWLEVRDHFSRALAAYAGVCINAENPSELPEPKELFP